MEVVLRMRPKLSDTQYLMLFFVLQRSLLNSVGGNCGNIKALLESGIDADARNCCTVPHFTATTFISGLPAGM
jgi:hypothetical protein